MAETALPSGRCRLAFLIITILFMGGLQLLALGAIGEYTGRILLNINNRPQYIIGETANVNDGPES